MPNIKSAKKRVLVTKAKDARNQAARTQLKTILKKFDAAVASEDKAAAASAYKTAVKALDKAAASKLIHKNKAANKKSALTLKLNAAK
ncbi:MAG: 30S ribosomal protein S20 [Eubacteriales bacterium]|nr:30S ribosomal protein S20 [Eubacteriales bacterium]